MINPSAYIGRFAPSPTGPLHFGSLVCALASFVDARHHQGQWLVRIEDIDPPREIPGATTTIIKQLESHGLLWDGDLLYQSQRSDAYEAALAQLHRDGLSYSCDCNRQRVSELGGIYDGRCRRRQVGPDSAIRLRLPEDDNNSIFAFDDLIMGLHQQNLCSDVGDFVIHRRDRLFSYQLAVTVDDQFQKVSHIIRGADLLDSTPRQLYLQRCLGASAEQTAAMHYGHLPLAINSQGQKLSKQNHAPSLIPGEESSNLWVALQWLQQAPPIELRSEDSATILSWAISNWSMARIPNSGEIPAPDAT
jgi:glutamyl-Q tRNA(Asp) synthetase